MLIKIILIWFSISFGLSILWILLNARRNKMPTEETNLGYLLAQAQQYQQNKTQQQLQQQALAAAQQWNTATSATSMPITSIPLSSACYDEPDSVNLCGIEFKKEELLVLRNLIRKHIMPKFDDVDDKGKMERAIKEAVEMLK